MAYLALIAYAISIIIFFGLIVYWAFRILMDLRAENHAKALLAAQPLVLASVDELNLNVLRKHINNAIESLPEKEQAVLREGLDQTVYEGREAYIAKLVGGSLKLLIVEPNAKEATHTSVRNTDLGTSNSETQVDQTKRDSQVAEIVDSDFFQELTAKAKKIKDRDNSYDARRKESDSSGESSESKSKK